MSSKALRLSADENDLAADGYFKDKMLRRGGGHGWMGHDCAVLTLVVHGRLVEGFGSQRHSCASWELHYKPPGELHTTATGPEGARMLLLGLRAPALARCDLANDGSPRALGGGLRTARALAMFADLNPDGGGTRALDPTTLRRLLGGPPEEGEARHERRPWWISEVHERVVESPGRDPGLERLAARFRVHPVYMARAFRAHFGRSIGEVRRRSRVEQAVARLTRGDERLARLAADLGYSDQSHFTREFKRMTGWSPGRFRRAVAALDRPRVSS